MEGEPRRRTTPREGWDLVPRAFYEQARNPSSAWGFSLAVLVQEKQPPNNITLGAQYWEMNSADGDRDARARADNEGERRREKPRRRTTLKEECDFVLRAL